MIEQGILLWNCFHYSILKYKERHPDWIFIKHEDLSANPCDEFRLLYEKLDLKFSNRVERAIQESSGSHNPIERVPTKQFKTDSRRNIKNWMHRLSAKEIETIRLKTSDISVNFYCEDDW